MPEQDNRWTVLNWMGYDTMKDILTNKLGFAVNDGVDELADPREALSGSIDSGDITIEELNNAIG